MVCSFFLIFRPADKGHERYQRTAKYVRQEMYTNSQQIALLPTQLTLNPKVGGSSLTMEGYLF